MLRLLGLPLVAILLLDIGTESLACASYCGAVRHCCCQRVPRVATCCTCTVMKTCCETVFGEEERTFYKTVYEDVVDKVPVDAVRYVEEIQYRCQPCMICQPRPPETCGPIKTCGPANDCEPCSPCMVPTQILRKVPYTTYRPEHYQKIEERPRVVSKQVPYTVTVCVAKVVYKQVPVTICCPIPCCGKPCGN